MLVISDKNWKLWNKKSCSTNADPNLWKPLWIVLVMGSHIHTHTYTLTHTQSGQPNSHVGRCVVQAGKGGGGKISKRVHENRSLHISGQNNLPVTVIQLPVVMLMPSLRSSERKSVLLLSPCHHRRRSDGPEAPPQPHSFLLRYRLTDTSMLKSAHVGSALMFLKPCSDLTHFSSSSKRKVLSGFYTLISHNEACFAQAAYMSNTNPLWMVCRQEVYEWPIHWAQPPALNEFMNNLCCGKTMQLAVPHSLRWKMRSNFH